MKIEININVSDKLVAFVKRIFTARNAVFATAAILFGFGVMLFAVQISKKNNFQPHDVIYASKINQNFDDLFQKVNDLDGIITGLSAGYGIAPIGSVVAWHKNLPGTPQTHDGWVECNGQTLADTSSPYNGQVIPNLNGDGRFLRGGTISGTMQESSTINYRAEASGAGDPANPIVGNDDGYVLNDGSSDWYSPLINAASFTLAGYKIRPVNMSVIWLMRVK